MAHQGPVLPESRENANGEIGVCLTRLRLASENDSYPTRARMVHPSARVLRARRSYLTLTAALTDEDLALKASSGDKDAFGALYERHYRGVYDLVVRMVREHDLAVDVVQNSFLNAWTNLQKRTVTGNIKAWLYTIARNSAIS